MSAIIVWSTALVSLAWLTSAISAQLKSHQRSDVKMPRSWLRRWPNVALALFAILSAAALLLDVGTVALGLAALPLQALGLLLAMAALVLSARAGVELGDQFASGPQVWAEQELVTRGLYALVRHPIYLGATAMWLGTALGVQSWLVLVVGLLVVLPAFYLLARQEEQFLEERFGQSYRDYQARVPRLFPWPRPAVATGRERDGETGRVGDAGKQDVQDAPDTKDIQVEEV